MNLLRELDSQQCGHAQLNSSSSVHRNQIKHMVVRAFAFHSDQLSAHLNCKVTLDIDISKRPVYVN